MKMVKLVVVSALYLLTPITYASMVTANFDVTLNTSYEISPTTGFQINQSLNNPIKGIISISYNTNLSSERNGLSTPGGSFSFQDNNSTTLQSSLDIYPSGLTTTSNGIINVVN